MLCHPRSAFIRRLQLSTHNSQLHALACQPSNPASSTPCHSLEVGAILLLTILVAFLSCKMILSLLHSVAFMTNTTIFQLQGQVFLTPSSPDSLVLSVLGSLSIRLLWSQLHRDSLLAVVYKDSNFLNCLVSLSDPLSHGRRCSWDSWIAETAAAAYNICGVLFLFLCVIAFQQKWLGRDQLLDWSVCSWWFL